MSESSREEILARLKASPRRGIRPRPLRMPLSDSDTSLSTMIDSFCGRLKGRGADIYRVSDSEEAVDKLGEVLDGAGIRTCICTNDATVSSLNFRRWKEQEDRCLLTIADIDRSEAIKDATFDVAEAGITGVDYGVAETGTLVLFHGKAQARLVSIAPPTHIAFVEIGRLVPRLEDALCAKLAGDRVIASTISCISGPSMSGDIAVEQPFAGMHGPKRLVVILIG